MKKILGAIPSPPDGRDYHLAMIATEGAYFPENFEIEYPGEVKNQGSVGSCVPHSLAYCREITEATQSGAFREFSTGFIYANRQGTMGELLEQEGMVPRDALKNLQKYGDVLEETFPHNDIYPVVKKLLEKEIFLNPFTYDFAKPYRIGTYYRLYTENEIKTALTELGPVTICVPIYPSFYKTGAGGAVNLPQEGEKLQGHHQMTITGWQEGHWKVLNSWGPDWGNGGYCYLPFTYPVTEYWGQVDNIVADTTGFVESIRAGVLEAYRKYSVLPSLTLAQAVLESNWGRAAPGNNLFGIKWTEGCGYEYNELTTWEVIDGEWVQVVARFRKYDSYADSIEDHSKLFQLPRYAAVLAARDYVEACQEVARCGYATDPEYGQKLVSLIESYNLNAWDRPGYKYFSDFEKVADWAKDAVEKMYESGLMQGDELGRFSPKNFITREEFAVVMARMNI